MIDEDHEQCDAAKKINTRVARNGTVHLTSIGHGSYEQFLAK